MGASSSDQINDCYATGDVKSTRWDNGGLVGGIHYGTVVKNSYSTGSVTSSGRLGGLVGYKNAINNDVISSYYDTETSELDDSFGGVGLISSEMKLQFSYKDWDFDTVWQMNDGEYPTLR